VTSILSRHCRPTLGPNGAASAGHPLATSAAIRTLANGGSAIDAAIAAQAVICVTMPHSAGLGGDLLALVHDQGVVHAVGGAGASPSIAPTSCGTDSGSSVTVPGLVAGWLSAHQQWGKIPLEHALAPAIALADAGYRVDADLATAVGAQRDRIARYGALDWSLLSLGAGETWRQPELAELLRGIASTEKGGGRDAFYAGDAADALAAAAERHGGTLNTTDLRNHQTELGKSVATAWGDAQLHVQPPSTQGTLLAMAARWINDNVEADAVRGSGTEDILEHLLIEATEAAFQYRDDIASDPNLLSVDLEVNRERASLLGGPRAYLHTAGVAVADSDGLVVSSLVSVFDDFGSGVYVPELGLCLNNRAAGFTSGNNAAAPGKKPVHTLAPAIVIEATGNPLALATPGADGQVQTIIQVLARMRFGGLTLAEAIASSRWRSEGGSLLIEGEHPAGAGLTARGHRTSLRAAGDEVFGAIVAAGIDDGLSYAAADWRRNVSTGAL
jgi:gamma-glutamyltranspeptidase/glutathione hydrolase